MKKRILATLLVVLTITLVFAACGKDSTSTVDTPGVEEITTQERTTFPEPPTLSIQNPTEEDTATEEVPSTAEETQAPAVDDTTTTEPVTQAPDDTTTTTKSVTNPTRPVTTTARKTAGDVPVGSDVAKILAFYNSNANAVKSAAKVTVKKHDKQDTNMDIPGALKVAAKLQKIDVEKQVAEQFGGSINKNETKTLAFAGGKSGGTSINSFVPVSGKNYVSALTAANVQSATCSQSGGITTVTMQLKSEPFSIDKQAKIYPTFMDVGFGVEKDSSDLASGGSGAGGDFGGVSGTFSGGSIVATFDANKRLTALTLKYTANIEVSILVFKIKIAQTALQDLTLSW
jgi:hypothetical protein